MKIIVSSGYVHKVFEGRCIRDQEIIINYSKGLLNFTFKDGYRISFSCCCNRPDEYSNMLLGSTLIQFIKICATIPDQPLVLNFENNEFVIEEIKL